MRLPLFLHIKRRIHIINVLLIELFAQELKRFTKSLEVNDLTLPKEFDNIIYIRVVAQAQDVVIGHPCLLFWCDHP